MTRFLLAAARRDWPEVKFTSTIERRDSLSDEPWPTANILLMNPPFVSLRDLTPSQRSRVTKFLGIFSRGRPDLSMAFVQRAVDSVAAGGVVGTLLPAGVLSMTYAQQWRRQLLDKASIAFLAVFAELGLFRLATVETGCVVVRKAPADENSFYKSLWVGEKRDATPEALRFLRRSSGRSIGLINTDNWALEELPAEGLRNSASWRPARKSLRRELAKIEAQISTTVSSLFEVKQGAIPAPREAFIVSANTWRDLPEEEKRWFRPIAENQNIRAGQILPGPYVFYPKTSGLLSVTDENDLLSKLPTFAAHLVNFKERLRRRRGKQDRWWELGEDREWLRSPRKKIVSSYFGQSGSFAIDRAGNRVVVQGYGWLRRWRQPKAISEDQVFDAYLAIFNSEFFTELLAEICPTVGGGQLNLSKRYSERVYLPDLIARVTQSSTLDPLFRDLAFIGSVITDRGLSVAPRARCEELVRRLYGV
jgi:hypothetical protein